MSVFSLLLPWCQLAQIELEAGQPAKAERLLRAGLATARNLAAELAR